MKYSVLTKSAARDKCWTLLRANQTVKIDKVPGGPGKGWEIEAFPTSFRDEVEHVTKGLALLIADISPTMRADLAVHVYNLQEILRRHS